MKKIFSVAVLVLLFNLTGCYTVIWTPGMDNTIPSNTYAYDDSSNYNVNSDYTGSNNSDSTNYNSINDGTYITTTSDYFYDPYYYGTYAQYYHHPWWLSYAKPQVNKNLHKKESDKTGTSTGVLRNSGEGRGDYGRNTGSSTGTIINNAPPTVSTSGSTNTGNSGSTTSGTTTNSRPSTT